MKPAFLLIHSPLVGPYTWVPVADVLEKEGYAAVVAKLTNDEHDIRSYTAQHIAAIANAYNCALEGANVMLVGHSGAGMLLPGAGQVIGSPAGYIFVDAGLPRNNMSRLSLFEPDEAESFRKAATGGHIPIWTENMLIRVIPDPQKRHTFVFELQPVPLAVYEEPIAVPENWPDAPCAYLSFSNSNTYDEDIKQALERRWAFSEMPGYHFHMLVDPEGVAERLVTLAHQIMENDTASKGKLRNGQS